jgi:hypothetical protein
MTFDSLKQRSLHLSLLQLSSGILFWILTLISDKLFPFPFDNIMALLVGLAKFIFDNSADKQIVHENSQDRRGPTKLIFSII